MYGHNHELRLFGHRGASTDLPENTLEAYRLALADGANALELDVHCTADGHIVVAHDPDGIRMAGVPDRISDHCLSDIKAWNVAAGFGNGDHPIHLMPTLEEVLDEFRGVPISVDLKPDDQMAVDRLYSLISAMDAEQTVTVGSFHDRLIHRLRRLGYQGPTALTRREVARLRLLPVVAARRAAQDRAAMIPRTHRRIRLDTSRFIRRCRTLGLRVDYWVVNEPDAARELLNRGATGIITDDPSRIAPVIEEFQDDRQA